MVLCWVIVPTVIAAVIALPAGLIAQDKLIRHLAASSANLILPASFVHDLGPGPARPAHPRRAGHRRRRRARPAAWAAASRTTTVLHAE
jgi:hypothetical protein